MSGQADYLPTASLEMLQLRASALSAVRRFFEAQGYLEVETPLLSHDIVVDAWLEPFVTHWSAEGSPTDAGGRQEMFLQTSPEFGMKRLLAAGAQAIFQVTRSFRNGERGKLHNPEFTMIEWYRVGDNHHAQMAFVESLVVSVYDAVDQALAQHKLTRKKPGQPLTQPFGRLSYDAAFTRAIGRPVLACSPVELAEIAREQGLVPPPGLAEDDRDGWLNFLLAERVEPTLGIPGPEFLFDYPSSQAALAKTRPGPPDVAERFELYLSGIEICNGYHELTDADELRRRIVRQQTLRKQDGRRELPTENRLLAAMEAGLPDCSGVALGFDRLLMLAVGAQSIDEVLAFPFERA